MAYSNYAAVVFVDGKRRRDYEDTDDFTFHARIPLPGTEIDLAIRGDEWGYVKRGAIPNYEVFTGAMWLGCEQNLYAIFPSERWKRGHDDFWWLGIKHYGPSDYISKLGISDRVLELSMDISLTVHPGSIGWRSRLQYWWDYRFGNASGGGAHPKNGRDVAPFLLLSFEYNDVPYRIFFGGGIMNSLCPAERIEDLDVRTLGGNRRDFWGSQWPSVWDSMTSKLK